MPLKKKEKTGDPELSFFFSISIQQLQQKKSFSFFLSFLKQHFFSLSFLYFEKTRSAMFEMK
jgi:EAL domain-containing protein (putative c-di-GMP-specific phosphodiesterase class I)